MNKIKLFISSLIIILLLAVKTYSYENFNGRYNYYDQNSNTNIQKIGHNDEEVLFIVDFSGSMNEKMGYTPKVYLAIEAIESILKESDGEAKIGLRIFGVTDKETVRQTPTGIEFNKHNICTASKLMLPIAKYNADNVSDSLSRINPNGGTPIGYSLRQAVQNDFSYGNHLKHIILVTDGGENCNDSPCLFIQNLMRTRNDIKIDVLAITVDRNAYSDLNCLAVQTNGHYYPIDTPEDFKIKFKEAFNSVNNYKPSVAPVNLTKMPMPINSGIKYKTYSIPFDN